MKIYKIFSFIVFLLIILLIITSNTYAWEIKKVKGYLYEGHFLVSVYFEKFPFQQLVLALKEQKNPILIDYKFEIYKKRFLLKDILLYIDRYYQKLYYNPETNLYYVEDNFGIRAFESPEEAVLSVLDLESYPIRYKLSRKKNSLRLQIKIVISYTTHLSDDLRYTKKEHFKKLEIEKSVDINEIFQKD